MIQLVLRRLVALVPILWIVSFAVFLLEALVPGSIAITLAGGPTATRQSIDRVRDSLHLNDPILVQYWHWLWGALHLNLGNSLATGQPVASQIAQRLPVTLSLVVAALVVGLLIGVPLGILSGLRPHTNVDRASRLVASLGTSIPNFVLGLFLVIVFAVDVHWFPPSGYTSFTTSPAEWVRDLTLPAIALGVGVSANIARQLRVAVLDVMRTDYIRNSWAVGASPTRVVGKHALKNAAIPVITVIGLQIGFLLGGTVLIEQIFAVPGLGSYMITAISTGDLPVVQAVTLVFVLFAVTMSLLADIGYGLVNPKIRVL